MSKRFTKELQRLREEADLRAGLTMSPLGIRAPRAYAMIADWGLRHLGHPFIVSCPGSADVTTVLKGTEAVGAEKVLVRFGEPPLSVVGRPQFTTSGLELTSDVGVWVATIRFTKLREKQ